jgi:hypothetical protein
VYFFQKLCVDELEGASIPDELKPGKASQSTLAAGREISQRREQRSMRSSAGMSGLSGQRSTGGMRGGQASARRLGPGTSKRGPPGRFEPAAPLLKPGEAAWRPHTMAEGDTKALSKALG